MFGFLALATGSLQGDLIMNSQAVDDWCCQWPRPEQACGRSFVVKITGNGHIDFSNLQSEFSRNRGPVISRWWKVLLQSKLFSQNKAVVPLAGFMQDFGGQQKKLGGLLAQLT